MSDYGAIRVERVDGLAIVTFDSPPLNLYDEAMASALPQAIGELETTSPRAVLFRAEGKVVTGGVDVHLFAVPQDSKEAAPLLQSLLELALRVERIPVPVVFAVHGLCLTWAFELALACDIILATDNAKFGLVERRVGLTPTMGGPQRLAERAGSGRAKELVMSGAIYPAAELERWNVVNRVYPRDGFDEVSRAYALDLAAGPPLAHAATKQLIAAVDEGGVKLANERVVEIAAALFDSQDLKGAVKSFLTDGPDSASFSGR
jgi:enoyl-CoA hydratase/carnithine racemase